MIALYNCTYDQFNNAATMKFFGIMCGSFTGAAISDRFRKRADFFLAMTCFAGGLSIAGVPWSPNLIVMGVLFTIAGLCHGTANVGKLKLLI